MLTNKEIEANKIEFLSLIDQIDIAGADIEGLKNYLLNSDFFEAPASTVYHCNFKGGLCYHSLNVFKSLMNLVDVYSSILPTYSDSTLITLGLLHDISKTNFYEPYVMNKKVYFDGGTKHDNMGKFDWVAEESYKVREPENRDFVGPHEELSALIVGKYIPLNMEETLALAHHHCNCNTGQQSYDQSPMLNKYPLMTLLHTADFLSTFLIETRK